MLLKDRIPYGAWKHQPTPITTIITTISGRLLRSQSESIQFVDRSNIFSESSGDSVLIGVEDNPEFRGYKPNEKTNGYKQEVSSLPFQNVSRRNPLMDDNSLPEPSFPPPPPPAYQRSAKRAAPSPPLSSTILEDDIEEIEDAMNSNFSFGSSVTEM